MTDFTLWVKTCSTVLSAFNQRKLFQNWTFISLDFTVSFCIWFWSEALWNSSSTSQFTPSYFFLLNILSLMGFQSLLWPLTFAFLTFSLDSLWTTWFWLLSYYHWFHNLWLQPPPWKEPSKHPSDVWEFQNKIEWRLHILFF